jgi:hypothetical protein
MEGRRGMARGCRGSNTDKDQIDSTGRNHGATISGRARKPPPAGIGPTSLTHGHCRTKITLLWING